MKPISTSNRFTGLVALVIVALIALAILLPASLPAQDIDDVIDRLDKDFSFGGKEEVKRQNVQQANEQNQEDIKIIEEAANPTPTNGTTMNSITVQFNPTVIPSDFNFDLIVNGVTEVSNAPLFLNGPFSQTFPVTDPVPLNISFPLAIKFICNGSGGCEASFTISGALNCGTVSTGPMSQNAMVTLNTTCTT